MSRRASLPGAEELFRRTSGGERVKEPSRDKPAPSPKEAAAAPQSDKSTKLQVAKSPAPAPSKAPKHDEKVTFYCTREDLMSLEKTRLSLRSDHGVGADRGKIVRAALSYVLEDFEARGEDSILLRQLAE